MTTLTRHLALVLALSALLFTGCTDQLPVEAENAAATDQLTLSEDLATSAAKKSGSITTTVLEDAVLLADGTTGTFEGILTITEFAVEDGQLVAVGTLTGTFTNATGDLIDAVTDFLVSLPVTNMNGTCDILHLEIGPIDLDLLGLVVHVDQIVVDIDAEAGSGNLLGNLLCAVAGLLDNPGNTINALAALLDQILGVVGDITV